MKKLIQRLTRPRWKLWVGVPLLLVLAAVAVVEVGIRTEWFRGQVRARIVAEVERATGGEAVLEEFDFDRGRLAFLLRGFTLRGKEPAGEPPLLYVPEVRLRISVQSWLGRQIVLESLRLVEPEIHLRFDEEGGSNIPGPAVTELADGHFSEGLLKLAVRDLAVQSGTVLWNQLAYPLSVRAEDFAIQAFHEASPRRYRADLAVSSVETGESGWLPPRASLRGRVLFYAGRAAARGLEIEAEGIRIRADADLRNFAAPAVQLRYRASADLPAALPRGGWLRKGAVTAEGAASWRSGTEAFLYEGRLRAQDVAAGHEKAAVEGVSARAEYSGDGAELRLANVEAALLGGRFFGEGGVRGWNQAAPRFWVRGEADGFEMRSVAQALRRQGRLPTAAVDLTSTLRAWLRVEGSSLDDLDAAASLIFDSGEVSSDTLIPLDGVVDVTYSGARRSFGLERVDLLTPTLEVVADGAIEADGRSRLAFSLRTADLADAGRIAALGGADFPEPPLRLIEPAQLEGQLSGRFYLDRAPDLEVEARLEAGAFQARGLRWDALKADLSAAGGRVEISRAVLRGYGGEVRASLAGPLPSGERAAEQALEGRAEAEGLALAELLSAVQSPYRVTGVFGGRLFLEGSVNHPRIEGEVRLHSGRLLGTPFDKFSAQVALREQRLEVPALEVSYRGSAARGSIAYELDSRQFQFRVAAPGWDLEPWAPALGLERPLHGIGSLELEGQGQMAESGDSLDSMEAEGAWRLTQLRYGEEVLGDWQGGIRSGGEGIRVDWEAAFLDGSLKGGAVIDPAGAAPFDGNLNVEAASVGSVFHMAGIPARNLQGEVDLSAQFSGELTNLPALVAEGTVDRLEAGLPEVPGTSRGFQVWNPFPMRWRVADGRLRLDRMRLLGDGTDVEIDGVIPADEEEEIDLDLEGYFNLAVADSFRPDFQASGQAVVETRIRGRFEDPDISGQVDLRNAAVRSVDFPNGLSGINGLLEFDGGRVRVAEVTASSGGGRLRLSGFSNLRAGTVEYRLNATAERVRLRYPEDLTTLVDGRLTFSGTAEQSLLDGEITVLRASTRENAQLGDLLASLAEPPQTPPSSAILRNTQFNIRVTSGPELEFQTSQIRRIEAEVDMRLVGTVANPSVLGRISINQGEVRFQGTRYAINRGDISFVNPFRVEPVLDFELETRVRDVDIALTLSGPARKLNLTYRSDPPLPFSDLVNLIAVGRAPTTDPVLAARQRVEQQSLFQSGANNVLANALTSPGSSRLQRFFGVSRLKVDPQIGGAEATPSARISTEQQITSDLTMTYSYDLSSAQQQVIRVEWAPNRRWSFIVTRDENGLVGSDILYKQRLR